MTFVRSLSLVSPRALAVSVRTGRARSLFGGALVVGVLFAGVACGGSTDGGIDGAATGGAVGTGAVPGTGGISGTGSVAGAGGGVAGTGGTGGSLGGVKEHLVVGYLPTYRSLNPAGLDFSTLTHLCIAFANPSGGSTIAFDATNEQIAALVDAAHASNVKVLASIAGAAGGADVEAEIQSDVDGYVADIVAFVAQHNLDGIDVDIEGNHVNGSYEPFVKKLSAALPAEKLLTAAVANWNGDDFSDGALAEYDFINVMSYDHCGPWNPGCEHSTIGDSEADMNYWVNDRGLAAERVVLGVPFYGYCFGAGCEAESLTYAAILSDFPTEAKTTDWIEGANFQITHNSAATIAEKAEMAKNYGGIMIWELGQDASGADSLFSIIAAAQ